MASVLMDLEAAGSLDALADPDAICESVRALAAALLGRANFTGLVLGCIEAKFRK